MQITKGVLALLLLTGACAPAPGDRGLQKAARKPPVGGVAELHVTYFDGRELDARVLIGAKVDPLVLDQRLFPESNMELNNIRACDTKKPLKHLMWKYAVPPPKAEDVLTVPRGYWYGTALFLSLFDKTETTEPDCFEAELVVLDYYGQIAATKSIQVVKVEESEDTSE